MADVETRPASSGRRNIKNLPPIQTSFNNAPPVSTFRWRRTRPVAPLPEQIDQVRVPLADPALKPALKPPPKLEHRQSKMSLFNLFSRPKVEKLRGHHETGLAVPMDSPTSPTPASTLSEPKPTVRLNPVNVVSQASQSQVDLVAKPKLHKVSTSKRPRQPINWDPPPLFQAYPQAIKYDTLQASTSSPDALLRSQSQRRQYNTLQEKLESKLDLPATAEGDSDIQNLEKPEAKHKRLTSASTMNSSDLTRKIYVLVTSGFVLQYADEGPFDRLPEKVLQLGKESAAFACDLIPGKHWVLQISQTAKEDGTVSMVPQKSFLSRLRLQNATAKRTATSFLLICESAEELDSWLTAVRREIDSLGGMKCRPDSGSSSSPENSPEKQVREKPSHRFLAQKDPNRFNSGRSPTLSPVMSPVDSPTIVAPDWEGSRCRNPASISDAASVSSSRYNSIRQSTEASSIATTAISTEQLQLNHLRDGSRLSFMSNGTSGTGTVTVTTSRGSSPAPASPRTDTFPKPEPEPLRSATSLKSFHMNPSTAATNRRRSMQTLPTTDEDHSLSASLHSPKSQRHSTYGAISRNQQEAALPSSPHANPSTHTSANQSPVRSIHGSRSSSAPPPRMSMHSPPPGHAYTRSARPQSTLGSLPSASTLSAHSVNRVSPSPKPFFRPLPIRTQDPNGPLIIPRRFSSLGPPPLPIAIAISRSVSNPTNLPPLPPTPPLPQAHSGQFKTLRRPTSMQIRSDPAPFLSSSRPTTAYSRTVPNTSYSSVTRPSSSLTSHPPPSFSAMRQRVQMRRSMPVLGLPPPAPPPNMPLPPPPPIAPPVLV
ncbi:hypothetical protein AOQ84DRAFT_170555 [Glonium stellatum]|uniref:PH domain-containing protein n=1 Tax=Glonium stellatum TaxID=574774 RepID=A0A8E2EQX5_9PEZI|nr:hypothetical protein AOQ84DRAFT_170555 [Glonium stellatum]